MSKLGKAEVQGEWGEISSARNNDPSSPGEGTWFPTSWRGTMGLNTAASPVPVGLLRLGDLRKRPD